MKRDPERVQVMLLLADFKGERINSAINKIVAEGRETRKRPQNGALAQNSCKRGLMYTTHVEEKAKTLSLHNQHLLLTIAVIMIIPH